MRLRGSSDVLALMFSWLASVSVKNLQNLVLLILMEYSNEGLTCLKITSGTRWQLPGSMFSYMVSLFMLKRLGLCSHGSDQLCLSAYLCKFSHLGTRPGGFLSERSESWIQSWIDSLSEHFLVNKSRWLIGRPWWADVLTYSTPDLSRRHHLHTFPQKPWCGLENIWRKVVQIKYHNNVSSNLLQNSMSSFAGDAVNIWNYYSGFECV
jgi:hypothetical protein